MDKLPGESNYFRGNDPKKWHTNVPNYAKVRYKDVYPGIDLVYHGRDSEVRGQKSEGKTDGHAGSKAQLEYDFVVAPGADPGAIRLAVETGSWKLENRNSKPGAARSTIDNPQPRTPNPEPRTPNPSDLRIDPNGDLLIATDGGEVRFRRPIVYQELSTISSGQFTAVSGQPSALRRQMQRATEHGQPPTENRQSSIGNRQFLDGRYVLLADNRIGFVVTEYDKTKPLIIDPVLSYSTYLGGSMNDSGLTIAVDPSGNAYVTGQTFSPDFPSMGPFPIGGGICGNYPCGDAFVTKLNAAGNAIIYSLFLGGSGQDAGTGISVDSVGHAYLTGYTSSTDFPVAHPIQATNAGSLDCFVTKVNLLGNGLIYSTYLGGSGGDSGQAITVDSTGAAYVAGYTASTDFPMLNPFQATSGGGIDAFVTKLNAKGTALVYSTYLGGHRTDKAHSIAVDTKGNAYVTGETISADFPTTLGAFDTTCGTNGNCNFDGTVFNPDAFVTKLNAAGSHLFYSTYLGGSKADRGYGIALDSAGSAYVTGSTGSSDFPTASPFQASFGGGYSDAFVTKLNAIGSALIYSTYLGGTDGDEGSSISLDSSGNAYVTGLTKSTDFPLMSPLQTANGGGFDVFVTELNAAGSALVYSTYLGGAGDDLGRGIALDSSANAYLTGQTFSTDFLTVNPFQPANAGVADAFVAKMSPLDAPGPILTPLDLAFADQNVGTSSSSQTVTLHNVGSGDLTISSIVTSGDFNQTNTCGTGISGGATCTVDVRFTPTTVGARTGALTVTDNAPDSPQTVSLSGTGVGPLLTISPASLDFGEQLVGTASSPAGLTLTNAGTADLLITSIAVSGDFAQTNNCGSTLAAKATCTVNVTFTPTAVGARTATLAITDNAAGSPQTVALSGTGMAPVVSLDVSSLSFKHNINIECPPKAVNLTNTGTGPLTITSLATSGPFGQTNTCGVGPGSGVVAAGLSCQILVTFTPPSIGDFSGDLTITDNASNNPQTVTLTGQGLAACVLQSPNQAARLLRGAETTTFTVSDPSPSCHSSTISLACVGNNPATCAFHPATIPPTGSSVVTVGNLQALGVDTLSFQATGTSGAGTTAVALRVLLADFFFTTYPATATVVAGEGTSYSLTVAPENGLAGNLALSCQGAPAGATCAVSPGTVALDGAMPMQAHVKVTTTARSLGLPGGSGEGQPSGWPLLVWALALLATLAAAWRARAWAVGLSPLGREGRVALGGLVLGASLVWVLVWAACGGGSSVSNPGGGTPPGTYTLTVTGTYTATTGQVNTLSHTTTLTLQVK